MSGQQCCSPLDSQILIKSIYARPPLWNKNHVSHKDTEVIEGLWNEVSIEVSSPKEVLKSRWKGLRDTFRKEYKKPGKSKWIHYKNLIFLEDMMMIEKTAATSTKTSNTNDNEVVKSDIKLRDRPIKKEIIIKEEVLSNCDEDDDNLNGVEDNEEIDISNFAATEMVTTEIEQTDSNSGQIDVNHSLIKPGISSECTDSEVGDTNSKNMLWESDNSRYVHQGIDDDYHFFMSLIPHVKTLPRDQKLVLRMKMQEIIYNEIVSVTNQSQCND
ncbi:uncharacterized protein LOC142328602 [Lycorma delicatula]|uniref:uncharacterized protein LOC142328602 n=1 Tax=Lycorma delicatula TaxID=130591 RepID=UPI003F511F3D